jgi:hypothetical protein
LTLLFIWPEVALYLHDYLLTNYTYLQGELEQLWMEQNFLNWRTYFIMQQKT